MEITREMVEKARNAKDAAELLEIAKAEGIELSPEKAEEYFKALTASPALSDEELDAVDGGSLKSTASPWPELRLCD